MALSSSLTSDIYKYVMGDDQRSHSAAEIWSCIRVKTVRKTFDANSRSNLMTYVLIDAFVMLALLLISS